MRYAIRNIFRNFKRSLILFALIFMILALITSGVFISNLCAESRKRSYGPLDGTFILTNEEGYAAFGYKMTEAMYKSCDEITEFSAVKSFEVCFPDLTYHGKGSFEKEYLVAVDDEEGNGKHFELLMEEHEEGFNFRLCTDMSVCEEVYSGNISMTEGSPITNTDNEKGNLKAVISDVTAKNNNLKLGDTVTLDTYSVLLEYGAYDTDDESNRLSFTVGGIYHVNFPSASAVDGANELAENFIYIPYSVSEAIFAPFKKAYRLFESLNKEPYNGDIGKKMLITGVGDKTYPIVSWDIGNIPDFTYFRLKNMKNAEKVEEAFNDIGVAGGIRLTPFMSDVSSSSAARLSSAVSALMLAVSAAGMALLFVVLSFNINSRKREIGTLISLGQNRAKTASVFILEVLMIFIAAYILCSVLGGVLVTAYSSPISAYLDKAELSAKMHNETDISIFKKLSAEGGTQGAETDFSVLFSKYIAPQVFISGAVNLFIIAATFVYLIIYIRKIDLLNVMGGRE